MDQPTPLQRQTEKQIDRIAFFSDAVFAIAMTLLALELRIPVGASVNVAHEIGALWPSYLTFALSFLVIGLYWNAHHRLFGMLRRYDRGLIWLNLLLLFCIVVLPYPTSVLGRHESVDASYVFYALWVALTGLSSTMLTRYVTHDRRLVDEAFDERYLRFLVARAATTPLLFLLSVPLIFVSHGLAQACWYASFLATRLLRRRYGIRGGIDTPEAGMRPEAALAEDADARSHRDLVLRPIGLVHRAGDPKHGAPATIEIEERYRAGLSGLGSFSHVLVLWWADRRDNEADRAVLRVHPRAAPHHETGVFAARSPARPNPVAVSVCPVVAVDEAAGTLQVGLIDAEDGTPVVDLKGYVPAADRVREPRVPAWLAHQSEWAAETPHDE